jgi:hypothetical protein
MDNLQFFDTVREMRHWQKEYFRSRSKQDLETAKQLEKKVDQMIIELSDPQKKMEL